MGSYLLRRLEHGPADCRFDPVSRLTHLQALVLLLAVTVLVANLLADLTNGFPDPRVRHGARVGA